VYIPGSNVLNGKELTIFALGQVFALVKLDYNSIYRTEYRIID